MLKLSEIRRVAETVDDSGRSELADRLASAWGVPAGSSRFWRSSASHVFAVALPSGTGYLRAVPRLERDRARFEAVARLTVELHDRGLRVAAPIPSRPGNLVEESDGYYSMVVEAAPGSQIETEALTPARAAAWGAALATLHTQTVANPPPAYIDFDADIARVYPDDPSLIDAAFALAERIRALPTDPGGFGLTHGDFELDNLAWSGDQPTAFDFDEARLSWFADDIAQATRDLPALDDFPGGDFPPGDFPSGFPSGDFPGGSPGGGFPGGFPGGDFPGGRFPGGDFLAGYAQVRPVPDLAGLRLFAAARAAETLVRFHGVLDTTEGPEWLSRLDSRLRTHLGRQRQRVIDMAHGSADHPGH